MALAAMNLLLCLSSSLRALSAPGLFFFSSRKPRYLTLTAGLLRAAICPLMVARSGVVFFGLNPFGAILYMVPEQLLSMVLWPPTLPSNQSVK